jgi:hypothetical protein
VAKQKRWACLSVDRVYCKIHEFEMRQRLAEVIEALVTETRQLQSPSAFSKESTTLNRTRLRFNPLLTAKKRKDSA